MKIAISLTWIINGINLKLHGTVYKIIPIMHEIPNINNDETLFFSKKL